MRAAKASEPPLRYYGSKTAEADEKRGVVEDTEGRIAAQDFSGEGPRDLGADRAVCPICPHACALVEGADGSAVRASPRGGQVVDANYGRIRIAGAGSHREEAARPLSPRKQGALRRFLWLQPALPVLPERLHRLRRRARRALARNRTGQAGELAASLRLEGNIGPAFTYNEPLVGLEFVCDTARLAHERGLANVLVSNGYVNDGPLHEVASFIDAANIDLKGFTQSFYDLVGGDLTP